MNQRVLLLSRLLRCRRLQEAQRVLESESAAQTFPLLVSCQPNVSDPAPSPVALAGSTSSRVLSRNATTHLSCLQWIQSAARLIAFGGYADMRDHTEATFV